MANVRASSERLTGAGRLIYRASEDQYTWRCVVAAVVVDKFTAMPC